MASQFTAKITAELDTSKIPSQLANIQSMAESHKIKISVDTSSAKNVNRVTNTFNDLMKLQSRINSTRVKLSGLDASKDTAQIKELSGQLNRLTADYNNLYSASSHSFSTSQLDALNRGFETTSNKLKTLDAKAQDTQKRLAESINTKISNGAFETSIAKVTADYERLATTGHSALSEVKNDIQTLNQLQRQMGSATNSADLISDYEKFNSTLQKVKNTLSTVSFESRAFASSLEMQQLDNKMATWLSKNTKAAKDYGASIQTLRNELATLMNSNTPVQSSSVKAIANSFSGIVQDATAAGKTGSTLSSRLKGSLSSISSYLSATTLFYTAVRGFKDMYQNVANIDSAMVELKKVTNETDETYSKFLSGTNERAQAIGTTISGLVSSTGDFARLGYTFDESQKLAETANIYAVVGDEIADVDTATKSIISTMKAFNIPVEDSMSIVDKFNEVGKVIAQQYGNILQASGYIG